MTAPKTIRRLLGVIALGQTALEFSLPIVTLIFFDANSRLFAADTPHAVRAMWYGMCISTPYFINLFFAPLISTLSDEFGRRKFLLLEFFSAFFYCLFVALGILYGNLWLLMTGFIIRGAFSRTNTTALAMIGDACSKETKLIYMGYLQVAISIGACVGPIVAGFFANRYYFNELNFSLPFFIAATLALINSVLAYFLIDETLAQPVSAIHHQHSKLVANFIALKEVVMHREILKLSLLLILFQISWALYYQYMPPLLKTVYHFDAHLLGIFIGMVAFWLLMGSGPIFKLLQRHFSKLQLLKISAVVEIIALSMTLATYQGWLPDYFLWISALPMAAGDVIGYICLVTLFSNAMPNHMQGKIMGINFLIVGLIWGCSGFIGGFLTAHSPILPLLCAPLGVFVFLLIILSRFGRTLSYH